MTAFKQKGSVGERPDKDARQMLLVRWQEQLYKSFGEPFDNYLGGDPIVLPSIPGLQGGSTVSPNRKGRLRVLVPYPVANIMDWAASGSSCGRVLNSCNLCTVGEGELSDPDPKAPRFADCQFSVEKILRALQDVREARARADLHQDVPAVEALDEYAQDLQNDLKTVGFNCDAPTLWWQRAAPPPPTCSFLDVTSTLLLAPGKLPSDLMRVFMPRLAGFCRTADSCIKVGTEPPLLPIQPGEAASVYCRVVMLMPVPNNDIESKERLERGLAVLIKEAFSEGVLARNLCPTPSYKTIVPPQYGLVPWCINSLDYLKRCPVDALHAGPAGMLKHLRKIIVSMVGSQPKCPLTGLTSRDALHNLHSSVRSGLSYRDGVRSISNSAKGVLKVGKIDAAGSESLHHHLVAALSAQDIVFNPETRRDILFALELESLTKQLAHHAPHHESSDPHTFSLRVQKLRSLSKILMVVVKETLSNWQASGFDFPKFQ